MAKKRKTPPNPPYSESGRGRDMQQLGLQTRLKTIESKKRKLTRPDRKQKHKKRTKDYLQYA